MATLPNPSESFPNWSPKAKEMAAEAKVLSGSKLEHSSFAFNGTPGVRKIPVGDSSFSTASRTSRTIDDGPIRSSISSVRNW
jgi:hypothetical protein